MKFYTVLYSPEDMVPKTSVMYKRMVIAVPDLMKAEDYARLVLRDRGEDPFQNIVIQDALEYEWIDDCFMQLEGMKLVPEKRVHRHSLDKMRLFAERYGMSNLTFEKVLNANFGRMEQRLAEAMDGDFKTAEDKWADKRKQIKAMNKAAAEGADVDDLAELIILLRPSTR
jgi:hypothetical protein